MLLLRYFSFLISFPFLNMNKMQLLDAFVMKRNAILRTTKPKVLHIFKKLHRTRLKVFKGDARALTAARLRVNEEFKKNKHVTDVEALKDMIKFAEDVEYELRTQVIQAQEVRPGVYEARITEETLKLENIPFREDALLENSSQAARPCCQEKAPNK